MIKDLNETIKTNSDQRENILKREIIKQSQTEIMELKSTIPEMKNSEEGFNNRLEQAERISN